MSSINHNKLPKEELIERSEKLEEIMASPFFNSYVALKKQMDLVAIDIYAASIKFGDKDDKGFQDLIKWGKEIRPMAESMDYLQSRLTPEERKKAETQKLKAKPTQVEANTKEAFLSRMNGDD